MTRLFADPLLVEVDDDQGVPRRVRLGAGSSRRPATMVEVERVCARWRVDGDWWRRRVARDYWKLLLRGRGEEAQLCEVYLDRLSGDWYLSRLYD